MNVVSEHFYTDLNDNLEHLVKVYRSLLEVVRKEKDILVAGKLDELVENNKAKDTILVRIRSLENTRMKCARDLAAALGADVENPRLLDIATYAETRWQDVLRNMHAVLDLLIRRVSEVNKSNEELVQAALSNITGAMNEIRDGMKPKATYARQGQIAQPAPATTGGRLVSKEA
ncbi:flagellar protein FlgN [bacterium]|nr:MAG: flagellar protein FlgN [bacterium]